MNHHPLVPFPGPPSAFGPGSAECHHQQPHQQLAAASSALATAPPMAGYAPYTPVVHLHGHFYLPAAQQFAPDPQQQQWASAGPAKLQFGAADCKPTEWPGYTNSADTFGTGQMDGTGLGGRAHNFFAGPMGKFADAYNPLALYSYSHAGSAQPHQFLSQPQLELVGGCPSSINGYNVVNTEVATVKPVKKEASERRAHPKVSVKVARVSERQPKAVGPKQPKVSQARPLCCRWLLLDQQPQQMCGRMFTDMQAAVEHLDNEHLAGQQTQTQLGGGGSDNEPQVHICLWQGCQRAGKEFKAKYKLKNHLRVHTGERPFACDTCGKEFARSENLKIHARIHTGDKPFQCRHPGCPKWFANSSDRKKHQHVHQQRKPYRCDQPGCGKKYTHPSSLRKHLRALHGQVMPSCTLLAASASVEHQRQSGGSGGTADDDSGYDGSSNTLVSSSTSSSITPPGQLATAPAMPNGQHQQQTDFLLPRFDPSSMPMHLLGGLHHQQQSLHSHHPSINQQQHLASLYWPTIADCK